MRLKTRRRGAARPGWRAGFSDMSVLISGRHKRSPGSLATGDTGEKRVESVAFCRFCRLSGLGFGFGAVEGGFVEETLVVQFHDRHLLAELFLAG